MWLNNIGERIAALRQMAGLSQREASRLAGLKSETHVGMIEGGQRSVMADTADALCELFGVSTRQLLHGEGKPPSAALVRRAVANAVANASQGKDGQPSRQGAA